MRSRALHALVIAGMWMGWTAATDATSITDQAAMAAFESEVVRSGYNCPRIVSVYRLEYQTERGQPFMVACAGGSGFFYRVTVQQRGTVLVEPWR
jgi:hypothetical protein